jgi:AcrR family transcriptional regulator
VKAHYEKGRRGARGGEGGCGQARAGAPARLSRQSILEVGLALLDREPGEPLTLSRVAEAVGAVPAALYRHVGSHDELIDGVLACALAGCGSRSGAAPAGRVRSATG